MDDDRPNRDPLEFHRKMPGYAPTPLIELQRTADELGLGGLYLKDESARLGLPAFKALGAWWAGYRLLSDRLGHAPRDWRTVNELAAAFVPLRPLALCAATDGSHGRAVARFARLMGLEALIFVPSFVAAPRIEAIRSEGAQVKIVEGILEDALEAAKAAASERCLLLSDEAWPGYEVVPAWVTDGYSTLFWEVDDQLAEMGRPAPDVVLVQMGCGALASAAVLHYRWPRAERKAAVIGVEPLSADCVREALAAGEARLVPGPHTSVMANLNCGLISLLALPILGAGMAGSVAIDDLWAVAAMRRLKREGVEAGVTGVAGVAGLLALLSEPGALRDLLLDGPAHILVLCTEGRAADPDGADRLLAGDGIAGTD